MFTINEALADDWVRVVSRDDALGIYRFKLGELDTIITVEIRTDPANNQATTIQTHFIETPLQPYRHTPSARSFGSPGEALDNVVNRLTSYYEDAVEEGEKPEESWLVPDSK